MATELQKAANRKNAAKSTGPHSVVGKQTSRRNALRHGLTAKLAALTGEDTFQYRELRYALFRKLQPDGTVETQLVERIASMMWRLQQLEGVETAGLQRLTQLRTKTTDSDVMKQTCGRKPITSASGRDIGKSRCANSDVGSLGRLSRYEASLSRELRSTVSQLWAMPD